MPCMGIVSDIVGENSARSFNVRRHQYLGYSCCLLSSLRLKQFNHLFNSVFDSMGSFLVGKLDKAQLVGSIPVPCM